MGIALRGAWWFQGGSRALPNATAHAALHACFVISPKLLQPWNNFSVRNMNMTVNIPPHPTPMINVTSSA